MATQIASLFGLISLKDEMTPGLEKAKGGLTSLGDHLKTMGQNVTGFGVTLTAIGAPFAAFAARAVQSAAESEDALAQLDAVLKSTGGAAGVTREELEAMAESLQKTTRYSDEATIGAESMLLTFTNVGKTVFPRATKAILDLSTAMKQDTKSSAIQLGKALNDPIEGITALTRVGVTFTKSQKEMIKSMVEAGDVAGAQTIILAELEKEFGGSAEAAGKTFAGSLEILKNRFDGVLETLGTALIPIIQQVTGWLGNLIGWFEALDPSTQQAIAIVVALAGSLAVIGPIIAGIGIAITALGGILAGPLLPIALLVAAVVGLAQHFGVTFEQIQVILSVAVLYIQYYFTNIVTAIQGVIASITEFINKNPEIVVAFGLIAGAIAAFGVAATVASTAAGVLGGILAILASPVVILAVAIAALLFAINSLYPGGLSGVLRDAGTAAQQLAFIIVFYLNQAAQAATAIVQAVIDKINELKNTLSGLGAYQGAGENAQTIASGLQSGQYNIGDVLKAAGNAISAQFSGAPAGAMGVPEVPRDNMLYRLHEGERVMTKSENQGGGGDNITIYVTADTYEGGRSAGQGAMDAIMERKRSRGG